MAVDLQLLKKAALAPALIHQRLLVNRDTHLSGLWKVGEASL